MFGKKKQEIDRGPVLTSADRKELRKLKKRSEKMSKSAYSAQNTIPYRTMFKNGICAVTPTLFTKTIEVSDINYRLKSEEEKDGILSKWRDFLNYFDPNTFLQLSFYNLEMNPDRERKRFTIEEQHDGLDNFRQEYMEIVRDKIVQGDNGLKKIKCLTFGVETENTDSVKQRLSRIDAELKTNLQRMGVDSRTLDGKERLELLHEIFHMDTKEQFRFNWNWIPKTGLTTKDFIAPSSFTFQDEFFRMGRKYCAASYIQIQGAELEDRVLKSMLDLPSSLMVSMHIKAIDRGAAIKEISQKKLELDRSKIDEQKKAVRSGYDMDILSGKLTTMGPGAQELLEVLNDRNEQLFQTTIIIVHTGDTLRQLKENMKEAQSVAQTVQCTLIPLDFQQEDAMVAMLPLGRNPLQIHRALTTSALSIFVPFVSRELMQMRPRAFYYGCNFLSNRVIIADRTYLNNPNGVILGSPGSGKSFTAKREIANCVSSTTDDIMICDPEGEYSQLVKRLKGQVIHISPSSRDYINPLDFRLDAAEDEQPLAIKTDFIFSLCELFMDGRDGLRPGEKSIISKCVGMIYEKYLKDPKPENLPILEDLYHAVRKQEGKDAKELASAMEMYVYGAMDLFNHRTNVNVHNRVICFDVKELGRQLKKIGMLTIQDQVWGRVAQNRKKNRITRFYIDEMHLLLKEKQTADYTVETWKRFRKWGGVPTGITQNISDFYENSQIANIIANSDFFYLLSMGASDREILKRHLNLSDEELKFITQRGPGEGLMIYGGVVLPVVDHFPKESTMYRLMTTRPEEQEGA